MYVVTSEEIVGMYVVTSEENVGMYVCRHVGMHVHTYPKVGSVDASDDACRLCRYDATTQHAGRIRHCRYLPSKKY